MDYNDDELADLLSSLGATGFRDHLDRGSSVTEVDDVDGVPSRVKAAVLEIAASEYGAGTPGYHAYLLARGITTEQEMASRSESSAGFREVSTECMEGPGRNDEDTENDEAEDEQFYFLENDADSPEMADFRLKMNKRMHAKDIYGEGTVEYWAFLRAEGLMEPEDDAAEERMLELGSVSKSTNVRDHMSTSMGVTSDGGLEATVSVDQFALFSATLNKVVADMGDCTADSPALILEDLFARLLLEGINVPRDDLVDLASRMAVERVEEVIVQTIPDEA